MILNKDTYRVGIYTRLSIDDGTNEESVRIDTQKKILTDFVASKGSEKYYIQSAFAMTNPEKIAQEQRSLKNIPDSFKKVIVVKNEGLHYRTKEGFLRISLLDFLTHLDSLDW